MGGSSCAQLYERLSNPLVPSPSLAPSAVSAPAARRSDWSLTALLCAITFAELLINRIFGRLIRLEPLRPRAPFLRHLDDVGLFLFELSAVLGVLLFGTQLVRIVVAGKRYRAGARISFALV